MITPVGAIDWWCRDRFDATPTFWSLLDGEGGSSSWLDAQIATWDHEPAGPTARTIVRIDGRRVLLWDGVIEDGASSALVRLVRAESGSPFEVRHRIVAGGFDAPHQRWQGNGAGASSDQLAVVGGHVVISADASELVSSVCVDADSWTGVVILGAASAAVDDDIAAWVERMTAAEHEERRFLEDIPLPHDHPSRAVDALRVLRVLTDRNTGAPVAAPTTSLPESPGGDRQYDYRYAWLRDAAYAVATAALLGRRRAADSYLQFLAGVVDRYGAELPSLTTTTGDPVPAEREVPGVAGWAGSVPVRVGNVAFGQRQLDSLATVLDAIGTHLSCGARLTGSAWSIVDRLATMLAEAPYEPTSGIWELRRPRLLVTDELARWIGLDTAERIRRRHRPWVRRPDWKIAKARTFRRVHAALDHDSGMLPRGFDGPRTADAATLLAVIHGFYPRTSDTARRLVRSTVAALEEGPFLRRQPQDPADPDTIEGAFLPASWWAVTALATIGDLDAAARRADDMCTQLPPLLAEEWDVGAQEALGNTPLLWSHTETARSLYRLQQARIRHRSGRVGLAVWRAGRILRVRLRRR